MLLFVLVSAACAGSPADTVSGALEAWGQGRTDRLAGALTAPSAGLLAVLAYAHEGFRPGASAPPVPSIEERPGERGDEATVRLGGAPGTTLRLVRGDAGWQVDLLASERERRQRRGEGESP